MATIDLTHRIGVSSSSCGSDRTWNVFVAGERQAAFTGKDAKGRAIESALSLAEELRLDGSVLVIVEPTEPGSAVTRVVRSRLAS
jgi:hypothetical protein